MSCIRWTVWQLVKYVTMWLEKNSVVDIINYLFSYISEAFKTTEIWSFLAWIEPYELQITIIFWSEQKRFSFSGHITCFSSSYFLICSCCNPLDCLIGCCQQIYRIIVLTVIVLHYKAEFIQVSNFFLSKFVPADFSLKLMFVLDSAHITEAVERTRCSVMELLCSSLHDKA